MQNRSATSPPTLQRKRRLRLDRKRIQNEHFEITILNPSKTPGTEIPEVLQDSINIHKAKTVTLETHKNE